MSTRQSAYWRMLGSSRTACFDIAPTVSPHVCFIEGKIMPERLQLTVKSKLIIMLLVISLVPIIVIGYLGWKTSRDTITQAAFDHLTSVRASKAYQIETYLQFIRDHVAVLSEDEMLIRAMVRFNKSFKNVEFELVPKEWDTAVDAYYTKEFFPRLVQQISGEPSLEFYKPESTAAHYLQYWYIANNEHPVGKKHELRKADDSSEYSEWHEHYHPLFVNLLKRFGYYDIFLIDFESRNIVYTVYKEADYATNLATGPYAQSSLAQVVEKVRAQPEFGAVQVVDFKPYAPSYGAPAAFFATPILNGPHIVGILAVQLPVDEIDKVMTGNRNWKADGLGRTGETFLVGSDFLMRSTSRFLLENPEDYEKSLREVNTPSQQIELMKKLKTSILLQEVDTEAAQRVIKGETGTRLVYDYRDIPALSAYAPLRIAGLDWAIVTKKDLAEVYQPIRAQQKKFVITGVILVALITFIAIAFANLIVQPLESLIASAQKVKSGQQDVVVEVRSGDEFGQLARAFNGIIGNLHVQNELIERKNYENRMLLENVLPQGPAERFKRGDEQVADSVRQVTVLYASAVGFAALSDRLQAAEAARLLNALWGLFDDAAEAHGVEPHQTIGERYLAVCGLAGIYLDHAKRTLDFALDLQDALRQFNTQHHTNLRLQIGVHSGPVMAGIVGVKRFKFDLWGETVNTALALYDAAGSDTILVSQAVHEQVHDLYRFDPHPALEQQGKTPLEVWVLQEQISFSREG
ncbi:MAG: HAMP domain-containing protein [Candidatus Tectomicrobia bacterium]|nr:HAMP domain-containing protein [Candidatus Tectomicrobia bacterium]